MAQKKTSMDNGTNYSFPYMREMNTLSNWENFQLFLWNPSEGTVFGRTAKGWAQLFIFYAIFFSALAALFAISMKGLLSTISDTEPKWKLDSSLIGSNPGVGFRPLPDNTDEGSLVWYDSKNQTQILKWVNLLNKFLDQYTNTEHLPGGGRNQVVCDFGRPPGAGNVCAVDVRSWHPCTPNASYSYAHSSPCFFLKLNRIYGWMPEFYDDPNNLPSDMPNDLKSYISSLPENKRRQVWISCDGENPLDKELLLEGGLEYVPEHGLPEYYFPYTNTQGYLSPLVAVRLLRPPMNRIINIECRAWAKNIQYVGGHKEPRGSVHFEVMID